MEGAADVGRLWSELDRSLHTCELGGGRRALHTHLGEVTLGHDELLILVGLLLALVLGYTFFDFTGVKGELGALVIGALIANHPKSEEISQALFTLKEFLLIGFFLSIGINSQLSIQNILAGAVLCLFLLPRGILYFVSSNRIKFRARTSLFTSITLTTYSEFSLIIVSIGHFQGLLSQDWLTITAVAVSLSFLIITPMEKHSEKIYERVHKFLRSVQNKTSKENHKKYEGDLKKVRNNREYNAIVKEQEYQELEIKLSEKKISQYKETIDNKTVVIDELKDKIKDRTSHLKSKNSELGEILKETEKEEKTLLEKSKEFEKKIEDNLIAAYKRIRSNVRNGLAIVPVERNASGGSYFTIPPQVQMEIASRQKIITDEYSGRILVDPKLAEEEMDKMKSIFS